MANAITGDHEHGTFAGVTAHRTAGTQLCPPCGDVNNDYHQAWRITNGKTRNLLVPLSALREVLAGADLATILRGVVGPRTHDAICVGTVLLD